MMASSSSQSAAADLIPLASFESVLVPGSSSTKQSIKNFIESQQLTFKKGSGYYELTKPEVISLDKKILVQRLSEPTMLVTGQTVKDILGIKDKNAGKYSVEEGLLQEFRVFIQSTSYNRNLIGGTSFLYVKDGTDPFSTLLDAEPTAPKRARTDEAAGTAEADAPPVGVATGATTAKGNGKIEIVFSFDTTGSMFPCLSTVRQVVQETLVKLFGSSSGRSMKIGLLVHGDYDHEYITYITKAANEYKLCDSNQAEELITFVKTVNAAGGGETFAECYEYVLKVIRTKFDWSTDPGTSKALVMIGDSTPHEPNDNAECLDWRKEAATYVEMGIRVYAVQALDYRPADYFWSQLANLTQGYHLRLHQFSLITDFMTAVCYHENDVSTESGGAGLAQLETELTSAGRMVRNLRQLFDKLQGKTPVAGSGSSAGGGSGASGDLEPISPSRFQVLTVDTDKAIKVFAEERGLVFKVGRGFYEFTKPEAVSDKKEVVLMDKSTGEFYTGWNAARQFSGITAGLKSKQKPTNNDRYTVFIQSSSYNRKLVGGSQFLYEVDPDS